jgi:histone H3/H4
METSRRLMRNKIQMEAAHHEHRVTLTMQDLMRYFRVEELHYK